MKQRVIIVNKYGHEVAELEPYFGFFKVKPEDRGYLIFGLEVGDKFEVVSVWSDEE